MNKGGGESMSEVGKIKLSDMTGKVTIEVAGQKFEAPIDSNEIFCLDLIEAIRRGGDPVEVLFKLANIGSKASYTGVKAV